MPPTRAQRWVEDPFFVGTLDYIHFVALLPQRGVYSNGDLAGELSGYLPKGGPTSLYSDCWPGMLPLTICVTSASMLSQLEFQFSHL